MRTTLNLKDDLIKKAMDLTNIKEKTALIHRALNALISEYSRERLISLGGSDKKAKLIQRRTLK